jgi:oligosaccharide repeat unit polymerase
VNEITLLYGLTIFLIFIYEIKRKKTSVIDGITFFNIWFLIVYLFIPLITLKEPFFLNPYFIDLAYESEMLHFYAYILIMLFYITVILVFNLSKKIKYGFNFLPKREMNYNRLSILLFIISLIGFLIFIIGYGGFSNVLANVNTIRSGVYERNTIAAIGRMFTNYSVVILLISFLIIKRKGPSESKLTAKFWFLISLVTTFIFTALSGGRGGFLFPILQLYFIKVLDDRKWEFKKILLFVPFLFFFLIYGKFIFAHIDKGVIFVYEYIINDMESIEYTVKSFLANFTHPYYSLVVAINKVGVSENPIFFLNPLNTIKFFMNLFGFPYVGTISHINTLYILGIYDSNIPPGIVGLAYYNFLFPGIIITAGIFGFILGAVEKIFYHLKDKIFGIVCYSILIDFLAQFTFNGDLRVFIMQRGALLILIVIILINNVKFSRKI